VGRYRHAVTARSFMAHVLGEALGMGLWCALLAWGGLCGSVPGEVPAHDSGVIICRQRNGLLWKA